MPTTYYYTVDGEMIGEHTVGQSRLDYIPDGLGSVVATVDQSVVVQSTARYKPYGAVLAATGTQPAFGWSGTSGSRATGLPHSDVYNRARHVATAEGRWTTVDPLWPDEPAFIFVSANPTTFTDPMGTIGCGDAYNQMNSAGGVPNNTALTNAGCGSCNQVPLSAGLMTCLWGYEGNGGFPTTGDTGVGPGNVTVAEIAEMCGKGAKCMNAILGNTKSHWKDQKGCIKYFEDPKNWKDQLKLAAAILACKGWSSYGYKSSCWQSAFEQCASCLTSVMHKRQTTHCPPSEAPCDPCFKPMDDCYQQVHSKKKSG